MRQLGRQGGSIGSWLSEFGFGLLFWGAGGGRVEGASFGFGDEKVAYRSGKLVVPSFEGDVDGGAGGGVLGVFCARQQ